VLGYTSGSTGLPKAVMMTHRQFRRTALILSEGMNYCADDRLPLFGALSGGQGISATLTALLNGAALCPFPLAVKGVTGLADWLTRRDVNIYASSASIFRNFMKTVEPDFKFSGIRAVRLSSEPATSDDFKLFQRHFSESCVFAHTLSCSETCNIAFSRRAHGDKVPEGRLAIGLVSGGQEVRLLDEDDRPVAAGEVGEIVVKSRHIAAGYWRNPSLTAKVFSSDLDGRGTRLVHTGDRARINADGMLEFFGRNDDRVKIRGNRIELSEVEHALQQLQGVARAVVEAVPQEGHEPVLVGFLTAEDRQTRSPADLRRELRAVLPDHMVPSTLVFLESFPFTPTGKIDREDLRTRALPIRQQRPGRQPDTEAELLLVDICRELFDRRDISAEDDFFELGGDSLLAAVVAARVHGAIGVELNLGMFAEHPRLGALAANLERLRKGDGVKEEPLVRVSRDVPLPLSFAQERAWLSSQTQDGLRGYVHSNRYRFVGPLDRKILRDCMSLLVKRHESLRTTFAVLDGKPVQIIHPPEEVALPFFDLVGSRGIEKKADHIFQMEAARPIDLGTLPLMRFALIRVRKNEHWLQRVRHHIISDGWSSQIFFDELSLLYAAKSRGETPASPEFQNLQYADYAAWERKVLRPDGPAFRAAVDWWKSIVAEPPAVLRLPCRRPPETPKHPILLRWQRLAAGFGWVARAAPITPNDGLIHWGLNVKISQRLDCIGRTAGATFFVLRLAAFVALLASETNERDILVGTYVNNRNRLSLQSIYGLFVNLVALRFRYQPEKSFRDWLSIVRDVAMAADARGAVPFELLCTELQRAGVARPPIEVIFQVSQNRRVMKFADVTMIWMEQHFQSMPWGFCMNPDQHAEHYNCKLSFDANIYDPAAVRAFVARYKRLLGAVSRHPELPVGELVAMSRLTPLRSAVAGCATWLSKMVR
jgi:non-ribosomal peptide synthetase component F